MKLASVLDRRAAPVCRAARPNAANSRSSIPARRWRRASGSRVESLAKQYMIDQVLTCSIVAGTSGPRTAACAPPLVRKQGGTAYALLSSFTSRAGSASRVASRPTVRLPYS